ncbi:hypothetical protein CI730_17105 [Shigella sonnei]|nr:hypothetical protein CI730_17105 [Shigella sonnei]OYK32481.1 hypothetical protein CI658_07555 [Shigella sonnei]BDY63045.1 hypothetical protein MUTS7_12860 [Escherichia coli]
MSYVCLIIEHSTSLHSVAFQENIHKNELICCSLNTSGYMRKEEDNLISLVIGLIDTYDELFIFGRFWLFY